VGIGVPATGRPPGGDRPDGRDGRIVAAGPGRPTPPPAAAPARPDSRLAPSSGSLVIAWPQALDQPRSLTSNGDDRQIQRVRAPPVGGLHWLFKSPGRSEADQRSRSPPPTGVAVRDT
jgi:hypothetical protein